MASNSGFRFVTFFVLSGVLLFSSVSGWGRAQKQLQSFAAPEAPVASPSPLSKPTPVVHQDLDRSDLIEAWCKDVSRQFQALKWKADPCQGVKWQVGGLSVRGRPLVYAVFGNPKATNTSLIFSTIHGDEVTPLYVGIKLAAWLRENQEQLKEVQVILAPLVNPDGFFARPRTRVNARGVDVNRNFATRDWANRAISSWKKRFKSDPRRNPGKQARSEPETIFQEKLVLETHPQKILAIHSPLNFLDYDGPTNMALARFPKEYIQECLKLRSKLKAVSGGFYPGSLGNFAGQELGIPTLTLELPSADPARAERYWKLFSQGIRVMIEFSVPNIDLAVRPAS